MHLSAGGLAPPLLILVSSIFLSSCKETYRLEDALPEAPGANVLVISFDALRADGLGLYGYHRDTSPNLDAFAREALVFDRAYSTAPVTPTSFAAAFTGLHPFKVFIGWQMVPTKTLAAVMREAGYHSFALLNNVQLVSERNFDQGFEVFETGPWKERELLQLAISRIDEAAAMGRPFFGWVHFISPHTPYDFRKLSAHLSGPRTDGRFVEGTSGTFEVETEEELRRVRDLYDGEVFFADYLFGELLAHLQNSGLLDETIVIVTADHGEEFMDHGQLQHNTLYEEVIRIPLLIRHPGNPAGSRSDAPVLNMDLLPTIASMTSAEVPQELDGIDLRAPIGRDRHRIVTAMTNNQRYEILSEQDGRKLIQTCTEEFSEELYDLNSDPGEKHNLILDDPALANHLDELLGEALPVEPCGMIRAVTQGRAPEDLLSPEQIEELKSLGYIQ